VRCVCVCVCVLAGGDECGGCGVSFHFTLFIATADSSYIVAGDPLSLSSRTHAHTHTQRKRETEAGSGRTTEMRRANMGRINVALRSGEGITVFRCALWPF